MNRLCRPLLIAAALCTGLGCSARQEAATGLTSAQPGALVLTTVSSDYSAGSLALVDPLTLDVTTGVLPTSGDPRVAYDADGWLVQTNALGTDTVRLLDPETPHRVHLEISVREPGGPAVNAVDARVCGDALWVAGYGIDQLLRFDAQTGQPLDSVSLQGFSDPDGQSPEAIGFVDRGDRLFLAMQRLDRGDGWQSVGSVVAELDCESAQVVQSWDVGRNIRWASSQGLGLTDPAADDPLWLTTEPTAEVPASVLQLDPATGAVTVLSDLSDTGLWPTAAVVWTSGGLARSVLTLGASPDPARPDAARDAVLCSAAAAETPQVLWQTDGFLTSVAMSPSGEAWVGQHWGFRTQDATQFGLHRFDVMACAVLSDTDAPLQTGLAPYSLALMPGLTDEAAP